MGTVTRLQASTITVQDACHKYLAALGADKLKRRTTAAYSLTLLGPPPSARKTQQSFCDVFGDLELCALDPDSIAAWFTGRWGQMSAQTWNANRAALRSAAGWWETQPDLGFTGTPFSRIGRKTVPKDKSRALSTADIHKLLSDRRVPAREQTLWSLLYESAARSAEVLRLNIEDIDRANNRAKVTRKGGTQDMIIWQSGTAYKLGRYLSGRESGPVFVTWRGRRADAILGPGDVSPEGKARLAYKRAEENFSDWTEKLLGHRATLHQLRHSALTHDAEAGASLPMLMTKSGHESVKSLARYAKPGVEALARWQADHDPNRRGR